MIILPNEHLAHFQHVTKGVDERIQGILDTHAHGAASKLYNMLGYALGFLDENFKKETLSKGGKRFRPALCLFLAKEFGVEDKALEAATAIELFHNFTLIHDDIEDHDAFRRGRETLWKRWGVNDAINSGDVLSLLACEAAANAGHAGNDPRITSALLHAFIEVGEGQHLDFALAACDPGSGTASEKVYLEMIEKKSGAMVGVAAEVAGLIAKRTESECALLRSFGRVVGCSYQLADDYRSVWNVEGETGKDLQGDIKEHKRTFIFFSAQKELVGNERSRLEKLYSLEQTLSEVEVKEVLALIEKTSAKSATRQAIHAKTDRALATLQSISIRAEAKEMLAGVVNALVLNTIES